MATRYKILSEREIKTDLTDNSDSLIASQKAVKTAVDAKQDALGFTAENSANKETSALDTSTTKYPCNNVVKTAVDGKMTNPMTTAGDIIYGGTSGAPTRLAKGTDGQVLTLASGVPSWGSASGGGVGDHSCSLTLSTSFALSSSSTTTITWDTEQWDTDSFHDNSTNPSRITIPSDGKYLVNIQLNVSVASLDCDMKLYKNGSAFLQYNWQTATNGKEMTFSRVLNLSQNDYLEIKLYIGSASSPYLTANSEFFPFFQVIKLA